MKAFTFFVFHYSDVKMSRIITFHFSDRKMSRFIIFHFSDVKMSQINTFQFSDVKMSRIITLHFSDGVKMESGGGQLLTWHSGCLTCSVCCQQVGLDNVVFKNSLFCKKCYIQSTLDSCDACTKLITGVGFGFRGKYWHDTCFGCDGCDTMFLDGKFAALRDRKLCICCARTAAGLG